MFGGEYQRHSWVQHVCAWDGAAAALFSFVWAPGSGRFGACCALGVAGAGVTSAGKCGCTGHAWSAVGASRAPSPHIPCTFARALCTHLPLFCPFWAAGREPRTCIRDSMARSFAMATVRPRGSKLACTVSKDTEVWGRGE
eukprot:366516-Chlamydomonas_euryale.AAC.6